MRVHIDDKEWVDTESDEPIALGEWVVLKDRKQAGMRDNGKIISNLYRCRYEVLSIGGDANAKLSFTLKEGDIVFVPADDVMNTDGVMVCHYRAIQYKHRQVG